MKIDLTTVLSGLGFPPSETEIGPEFSEFPLSFFQLRDRLILSGSILYEDIENQVYVASVKCGLANMGHAAVAIQLTDGHLFTAGCAHEGLIRQNLLEKAFCVIEKIAHSESSSY